VTAYSIIRIWCDYREEGTGYLCTESFESQHPGFEQAREAAVVAGWGRVAASGTDEGDRCPQHKPAAKENPDGD
jgi:hypothetical protein